MTKFTFKKEPRETGLRNIARPYPDTIIKLNGKQVGMIAAPGAFSGSYWRAKIIIVDDREGECGWRWVTFSATFNSEILARNYITSNAAEIQNKYQLHPLED